MNPAPTTEAHLAYWADHNPRPVVIGGPEEGPDVTPCPAVVTDSLAGTGPVVRVAWRLDEIELAHLAQGGTLWARWGGLPIHMLEVQPPRQP